MMLMMFSFSQSHLLGRDYFIRHCSLGNLILLILNLWY